MKIFYKLFLVLLIATFVSPIMASEIGDARTKRFKQMGGALKSIAKKDLPAGNLEAIKEKANIIIDYANEMPDYFPQGSDEADDKARAEIWDDFGDFKMLARDLSESAQSLEDAAKDAAKDGDMAALGAALKHTGGRCKACHLKYKHK